MLVNLCCIIEYYLPDSYHSCSMRLSHSNVDDYEKGECPHTQDRRQMCPCNRKYEPVCASGITYSNACVARCK